MEKLPLHIRYLTDNIWNNMTHYSKFIYRTGYYRGEEETSVEMCIISNFLTDDVGCGVDDVFYVDWLYEADNESCGGNITQLYKEGDYIELENDYPVEEFAHIVVRMRRSQFIKLLNDWKEIVCKNRPEEVILRYENDEYTFEVTKP
jgi:hypothetical protein